MKNIHVLKCNANFFQAIVDGKKYFEVRIDDRNYRVDDILRLCEVNQNKYNEHSPKDYYTGREISAKVTYILPLKDVPGMANASVDSRWIIMSIEPISLIQDEKLISMHETYEKCENLREVFDLSNN